MEHQDKIQQLKLAQRGPIVSITVYLLLAIIKISAGILLKSASLSADGFNNASDILGNVAILIGLYLASKPADDDHRFGHWKIEDLASLITSLIMFTVGFQLLLDTIKDLFKQELLAIDPVAGWVGIISGLIMIALSLYNRRLAKITQSSALIAAAKNNSSDALTSFGTTVAILASSWQMPIIDKLAALVIAFFILKASYDIFIESTFSLSDGFDKKELQKYEQAILEIPKITAVKSLRGRTYGSNIFLDIVLEMNPDLSVYESHAITDQVDQLLQERFDVYDIDIHVEPAAIPEDEIYANVYDKLYQYEKAFLSQTNHYEKLIAKNFYGIDQQGNYQTKNILLEQGQKYPTHLQHFKMTSVSQKTKLLTYQVNQEEHVSIWRRHENWSLIFHQITPKITQNPQKTQ
ncbi:cation diffusion facilitator family transporter [Streptococcus cuniculipharyngis]|uniref:Cation transporter n=1 Tax=Streptococcus cuniculipharyngis TaxID=1562651 RepID=A0A5C5SFZ4_9STRE|nr:cation diffusion facilitator family transporter [Streptococcus cuniculipharyngis]TWS99212.1 cation transporter [Streptococcus cuniculipharyngis]